MRCSLSLLLLFCAFCIEGRADDFSGASPSGKLYYESKKEKEFYIWYQADPKNRVLLHEEKNGVIPAAAISPDDVWIALEYGSGSMGHTILFFKRQTGLDFKQVDNDLPAEDVGTLALLSKGIKENFLDHIYLHPIEWSEDSKWLTVAMDASGLGNGERVQVRNWRCRYNLVSHALEKVKSNPGKIEVNGKEKEDAAIEETGVNAHPKAEETTPESTRNGLDRADVRLNQVYAALRLRLGASEKEALKREQIKWLAERDKITDEVKRLEFIEERVRELEQPGVAKK
jgi:lysozyme inhibitor LprI